LLGQEGVLKQLNGRMTALQLALEDLTKVEKAQLSGTWNLPSGATALVPISSLDIQRWNAQGGGGGLSAEAMAALLAMAQELGEQQGVGGGGRGGGAGPAVPTRVAIERIRIPEVSAAEQRAERLEQFERTRRRRLPPLEAEREEPTRAPRPGFGERQAAFARAPREQRVEVSVAMQAIRATLNVNIPVVLNGQVIARAMQSIFYQWLQQAARGSGHTTQGVGSLR